MSNPPQAQLTDDQKVDLAEGMLLDQGARLRSFESDDDLLTVAAHLGRREYSLYEGLLHGLSGPSNAAVCVVLRALLELAITVPWMWLRPDVHYEMWEAENDRRMLNFTGALRRSVMASRMDEAKAAEANEIREHRVAAARQKVADLAKRGAAVRGLRLDQEGASLIPSVAARAAMLKRPEITEAYEVVYSYLSTWVHSATASFVNHDQDEAVPDPDGPPDPKLRSLAATLYAIALGDMSRILGLGVEDLCDQARVILTGRPLPPGQNRAERRIAARVTRTRTDDRR